MKFPKWPLAQNSSIIKLGLERVLEALARLDNPHEKLPPVVHVAGTNGKGSTIAFLRAMLEADGKVCHVYTSPHLVEFNERIVLAGKEISDTELDALAEEVKGKCGDMELTFFEGTTIMALLAFSRAEADIVLLETGMGGRLDATNVVARPVLTIITPISKDHTEFLGNSITEIAAEKAGIMKESAPCIISEQSKEAMEALSRAAKERDIEAQIFDKDFYIMPNKDGSFIYRDINIGFGLPRPNLRGKHQIVNAGTAVAAALELGVEKQNIKAGIKAAEWKARLQKLADNIYLDGGHNVAAAETIRDFVKTENGKKKKHNIAIVRMLKTKDIGNFIKTIKPSFNEIFAVALEDGNCHKSEDIKAICDSLKIKCSVFDEVDEAYKKACNGTDAINNRVVICGSLHLAGEVLGNGN